MTNRDKGTAEPLDEDSSRESLPPGTASNPRPVVGGHDFGDAGGLAGLGDADEAVEALTIAASLNAQTMRTLLSNRNFIPLWIGQMMSYLGDQFTLIAALAVVTQLAGANSGLATAALGISNAAPSIFLGLVGGVLVDRLDRKLVMILADVVRGIAIFSLFFINGDPSRLWIFFIVLAITGGASTLFYPARASALPALVTKKELAGANALLEAGFVIALVFGALLAGVLVQSFGPNLAFGFNGAAYFFSALMIMLLRIPKRQVVTASHNNARQVWFELRDGLSYVWRTRSMRYIMGISVMVFGSIGAVLILSLDYLTKILHVGPSQYGLVIAILGVGIVLGGVLIQRLSKYLPTNRLVAMAIALNGLAMLGFVLRPVFNVVCAFTALIGFSMVVARAILGTLTQAIPPEEYRGRVQAVFNLMSSVPLALAVGIAGLLVQVVTNTVKFNSFALPNLPGNLLLYETNNQWAVFMGFGIALLLTAWLAVNMLKGIDEAIFSEADGS